jgi:hypothetical protein
MSFDVRQRAGIDPLAAAGAAGELVLAAGVGIAVRAPLARVPENTMKFAVGVTLSTFGISGGTSWSATTGSSRRSCSSRSAPPRHWLRQS